MISGTTLLFLEITSTVLLFLRLVVFGLSLGLTLVSYQAYRQKPSPRLESAFIGFAFLSMGVGLTALRTHTETMYIAFQIAETIPFIVGFGMLYRSLYR